jgi:hypothetical protein
MQTTMKNKKITFMSKDRKLMKNNAPSKIIIYMIKTQLYTILISLIL